MSLTKAIIFLGLFIISKISFVFAQYDSTLSRRDFIRRGCGLIFGSSAFSSLADSSAQLGEHEDVQNSGTIILAYVDPSLPLDPQVVRAILNRASDIGSSVWLFGFRWSGFSDADYDLVNEVNNSLASPVKLIDKSGKGNQSFCTNEGKTSSVALRDGLMVEMINNDNWIIDPNQWHMISSGSISAKSEGGSNQFDRRISFIELSVEPFNRNTELMVNPVVTKIRRIRIDPVNYTFSAENPPETIEPWPAPVF